MAISSLRMPASDVYDALSTLDDFTLNEDQIQKVCLMIPEADLVKQLEDNRAAADELSKEEKLGSLWNQ